MRSTAAYLLREATMNEEIAKRIALGMAILCVRNTCIEDLHAGIEPSSQAGDFSDVKVVTRYGEIPWNERMDNYARRTTAAWDIPNNLANWFTGR